MLHGHLAPGALVFGIARAATNALLATAFVGAALLLSRDKATRHAAPDA